jgi:hypothetical protein
MSSEMQKKRQNLYGGFSQPRRFRKRELKISRYPDGALQGFVQKGEN